MTTERTGDFALLPTEGLIPIRTVSSLTGVSPVTLRAWERRYGLIKPVRTPKGHRLYTMDDVELINQALALLAGGMSISQVGRVLSSEKIKTRAGPEASFDPWSEYRHRMIQAIVRFDDYALNDLYHDVLSLYPVDIVTTKLIVPLLRELGSRWEQSQGSVAEEHFFSVFLRNKLGARFHHRSHKATGSCLLAACMPAERHEVGILLFALSALDRNYRVVLLGADTPLEELPLVVERADCQAIVLSGSAQVNEAVACKDLPSLLQQLTVPLFIGGKVTTRYAKELAASKAICLGDDYILALRKIDTVLGRKSAQNKPSLPH